MKTLHDVCLLCLLVVVGIILCIAGFLPENNQKEIDYDPFDIR